jgi:hypothetical protein
MDMTKTERKGRHFPGGWRRVNCPRYNERIPADAAQGVRMWYRELNGRMFRFTLVVEGWWGVGETGTLRVKTQISNGDWYTIHEFTGVTV